MRKKERKSQFIIVRVTEDEKRKLLRDASKNMRSVSKHIRVMLGIFKSKFTTNENNDSGESAKQEEL